MESYGIPWNVSDIRYYWPEGIRVEKYMYTNSLALKELEEGGLLSHLSQMPKKRTQKTALPSAQHH
jgi:hypothetical protein